MMVIYKIYCTVKLLEKQKKLSTLAVSLVAPDTNFSLSYKNITLVGHYVQYFIELLW